MQAESKNFKALVQQGSGSYNRVDVAILEPVPHPKARPEAG
jgi:hypothetical protein